MKSNFGSSWTTGHAHQILINPPILVCAENGKLVLSLWKIKRGEIESDSIFLAAKNRDISIVSYIIASYFQ